MFDPIPDLVEFPDAPEFFVDGAVCRTVNGVVRILGYRQHDIGGRPARENTVIWLMPLSGFEPSFVFRKRMN